MRYLNSSCLFGVAALLVSSGVDATAVELTPRYRGAQPQQIAMRQIDEAVPPAPEVVPVVPPVPCVVEPLPPLPPSLPPLPPMPPAAPVPIVEPVPVPVVEPVEPVVPIVPVIAPPPAPVPPPPEPPAPAVQEPTIAPPVVPQVAPPVAPQVYYDPAQLAHIETEIEKLKADLKKTVKTPDTKKGWSSPKVGGRIFFDSVNYADQNGESVRENGNLQNSLGLADGRIAVSGTGFDVFEYKFELGFGSASDGNSGQVGLRDIYFGAKSLPLLNNFRVGYYRPESSLGYLMSPLQLATMNYTNPSTAFSHVRRLGVSSTHYYYNERIRWTAGVFQGGDIQHVKMLVSDDQGVLFNTRLTATPIYACEGKYLWHIGGTYTYHSPAVGSAVGTTGVNAGASMTVNAAALRNSMIATGTTTTSDGSVHQATMETILQYNSLGLAGEVFVRNYMPYSGRQSRTAYGAWAEARYILCGAARVYETSTGTLGALKPYRNFHPFQCNGWNLLDGFGAFELATQWNYADFTDWRGITTGSAKPGQLNEAVFAVNWLWSPNVRWIAEYARSWQDLCAAQGVATTDTVGLGFRVYW